MNALGLKSYNGWQHTVHRCGFSCRRQRGRRVNEGTVIEIKDYGTITELLRNEEELLPVSGIGYEVKRTLVRNVRTLVL